MINTNVVLLIQVDYEFGRTKKKLLCVIGPKGGKDHATAMERVPEVISTLPKTVFYFADDNKIYPQYEIKELTLQ